MKPTTHLDQRFTWLIGAIQEEMPDVPEPANDLVLWDRQERKPVVTVPFGYGNLICLETKAHSEPFTQLEWWLNRLDADALESENIPGTRKPFTVADWSDT